MKLSMMTILEDAAKKAKQSGSMVAFFIPPATGKEIQEVYSDVPGDMVKPKDMHITIGLVHGFSGKEKKIKRVLDKVAESYKPMMCRIKSFETFEPNEHNENKWVLYAKPEFLSDDIQEFRDYCHKKMKKYGIDIDNGSFDFSPHITVKYCSEEPDLGREIDQEFILDSIYFAIGDKHWRSKLG